MSRLTITGMFDEVYNFDVYDLDAVVEKEARIYLFTKRYRLSEYEFNHELIFCGQANDFSTYFKRSNQTPCFQIHRPNCICLLAVLNEEERNSGEKSILRNNYFLRNQHLN